MLLLVGSALAGTVNLGWPCSRMNWAWRNVWSTCSINSYIPTDAAGAADHAPAHWRKAPIHNDNGPTSWLDGTGVVRATGAPAGLPQSFCNSMDATMGNTAVGLTHLRNRCRRAIDAYGGLVRTCTTPAIGTGNRGPVSGTILTDFAPQLAHVPHQTNVINIARHAAACTDIAQPGTFASPHTTCPGLLGWWTVVWAACNIGIMAPNVAGDATVKAAHTPKVAPLGTSLSPAVFLATSTDYATLTAPQTAGTPGFIFCAPSTTAFAAATPERWNNRGPEFRSTRCRKALDQFGRTAWRCGGTTIAADAPTRGSADVLRYLLLGHDAGSAPRGLGRLAPLCN